MDRTQRAWSRMAGVPVVACALSLAVATPAFADTTIGQAAGNHPCAPNFVAVDPGYQVPPGGGQITGFSYADDGHNAGKQLDFEILQPNSDGSYTIVGHTGLESLLGSDGVETFPAHLAVSGGQMLGFFETGTDNCLDVGTLDQVDAVMVGSDPSPGTTLYGLSSLNNFSLNESATLAPPSAALAATGETLSGTEGRQLSGPVATFSDQDAQPVADYAATIDWADGSTSPGTVSEASSGNYEVDGAHLYAQAGDYMTSVEITDGDGASVQASGSAAIADAPLSAAGLGTPSAPELSTPDFTGTLATVTDGNPSGSADDLSATIDWGDGTTSQGGLSSVNGTYTVSGSHSYLADGPHTVRIHVADAGGSVADATSQLLVYQNADQTGGSFVVGDGGGSAVYFWGARWGASNMLSDGTAPRAFKGFAGASAQSCGDRFTATGGDGGQRPATVPSYLAVAVTGAVTKRGSTISGTVEKIEVVRTDPGYGPDPGLPGTGQVVATLCG